MMQATALAAVPDESPEEVFEAWYAWMAYRELSPNTVKLYVRTVLDAYKDLGDLRQLTRTALEGWVQSKKGKAGTQSNRICALTSFYRFLVRTDRRPDNPAAEIEKPRQHKRLPKPVVVGQFGTSS